MLLSPCLVRRLLLPGFGILSCCLFLAPPPAFALRIALSYYNQNTLYTGGLDNNVSIGVYDGAKPYSVTSATGAVRIEPVPGTTHLFKVIPVKAGTDTVTARDAKGQTAKQAYTVATQLSHKVLAAERYVGEPFRFQVSGGVPPYSVTAYNAGMVSLKDLGNGLYEATLKDTFADLMARDSKRGAMNIRLEGKAKGAFVPPVKAQLSLGQVGVGESTALTVRGGAPPYTVSLNNDGAEVKNGPSSAIFSIVGRKPGTTVVTARDSKGATNTQTLYVQWKGPPLMLILSDTTCTAGGGVDLAVNGGAPAYTVTPSSAAIQASPQGGARYRIACVSAGQAKLDVSDSAGNRTSVTLAIAEPPPPPLSFKFSSVSIPIGSHATLDVSGGKPPYLVTAKDGKARVQQISASSFRIEGVAKGTSGIIIKDGKGSSAYRAISVTQHYPMKASLSRGTVIVDETTKLMITHGKPPFTVTAAGPVEIKPDNTYFYSVTPRGPGSFAIKVKDTAGETVSVPLTVSPKPVKVPPLDYKILTSGPHNNMRVGGALPFQLTGGTQPYSITAANPPLVLIRQTGQYLFEVRAKAKGSTIILIRDASGKEIKHPLNIFP